MTIDETTSKDFTVSLVVDSGSIAIVEPGSNSSLNFTIPADLPEVSLNYSGNGNAVIPRPVRMTIQLSEALSNPVSLNIVGNSNLIIATDYVVQYRVLPAGQTPPADFTDSAVSGVIGVCDNSPCPFTIPAGMTTVDIAINALSGASETIAFSIEIPSASSNLVRLGSTTSHTLTVTN